MFLATRVCGGLCPTVGFLLGDGANIERRLKERRRVTTAVRRGEVRFIELRVTVGTIATRTRTRTRVPECTPLKVDRDLHRIVGLSNK